MGLGVTQWAHFILSLALGASGVNLFHTVWKSEAEVRTPGT